MSNVIKMKNNSKNKKYWEFKNQTEKEADLYLYHEIASWGGGYYAHSAKSFKSELDDLGDIDTLNIYLNSPGGDVFEGVAIYNMLKRHKAHVNVHVDGLAASIASLIAMAGDTIKMPSNAMMMIHNAWTFAIGDSKEFLKASEMLDKVNTSIRQSYVNKVDGVTSEDDLIQMMDDETWLTAQECYDYGLCDEVGDEVELSASISNNLFNSYKNVPKHLINKVKDSQGKKVEDSQGKTTVSNVEISEEDKILLARIERKQENEKNEKERC